MTKPNYHDLLRQRAAATTRHLQRVPLCLQPDLLRRVEEARLDLFANEEQAVHDEAFNTDALHQAQEALAAAQKAAQDVTMVLVMESRTSTETARTVRSVRVGASEAETTAELHQALVLDSFQWAETLDGERLVDVDAEQIKDLLPALTDSEVALLIGARVSHSDSPQVLFVAETIASDALLRADLRICRAHGWTWGYWIDELDDTERALWREFSKYEADLCPGCGQPRSQSLWAAGKPRAKWSAGYTECGSCHELGRQQEEQRIKDAKAVDALTANHKKPHLVKKPVVSHRHWLVQPAPEQKEPPARKP